MSQLEGGRERQVSRALVSLADTLVADYDVIDLLDQLVTYSVTLLNSDAAGILLANERGELRAVAASSEDAETLELLQLQTEQGPCVECFNNASPVSATDLSQAADRWPRFVAAVTSQGVFASVHAVPLRLRGQAIGALNLLGRAAGALSEDDLALGQALADMATIGILQQRAIHHSEEVNQQLQTALNSRVFIEQAKGVLAHHLDIGTDAAFNQLRSYARARNLRLTDVARLIATKQLDPRMLTAEAPKPQPRQTARRR